MDLDATLAKHGNRLGEIERFVERVKALIDGEPSPLQQTAIEEFEGLVAFKSEFESALPELRKAIADVAVVIDDMGKIKRSEEHTSELQSPDHLVCRLLLEKKTKDRHQ